MNPFDAARELSLPDAHANIDLIESFFETLGRMDFEAIGRFFTEDGVYADVPLPAMDAVGPEAITAELVREIVAVEDFVMGVDMVVGNARCVTTRRCEEWHFTTGEVAEIDVLCAHEISDGKITRWQEFWDQRSLMRQLPPIWHETRAGTTG